MASLTVRNIPEDAKLRFRQVAAAHGRSMEEHLRQLVIEAEVAPHPGRVSDAPLPFRHAAPESVRELLRIADGAEDSDSPKYAEIRFMTAKAAMAELRRLANGAGLDVPAQLSPRLEAPDF